MRLHVDTLGAEKFFGPLACQLLHHVGKFTSAVIPFTWISFRILVRKYRSSSLKYRFADKVLRGNQLQPFMLAACLVVDGVSNLRVDFKKRQGHGGIFHRRYRW